MSSWIGDVSADETEVASWLARRYANSKIRGANPGLDRLRSSL